MLISRTLSVVWKAPYISHVLFTRGGPSPLTSFHTHSGAAVTAIFLLTGIPCHELAVLEVDYFHTDIVVASLKIV